MWILGFKQGSKFIKLTLLNISFWLGKIHHFVNY